MISNRGFDQDRSIRSCFLLSKAPRSARRRSATLRAAPRRSAPLRSAPLAQAVRAAAARRQVDADLDAAEASGERDHQAAKRARSASAVAAAAASSSLSSVRETSIGASSESQKLRIRRFQRDIGPLLKLDQPIDQRQDSTLAAVLGEPPTLQFSLQLAELLFEHADSAANATIFLLSIIMFQESIKLK